MKKFIPTIIAIVLIILVGGGLLASKYIEKYSYTKEKQDMDEYYGITQPSDVAIIMQNQRLETKARMIEGFVYLDLDSVKELLNDRFYVDTNENWFIYTTPTDIIKSRINEKSYMIGGLEEATPYTVCIERDGVLYVALDYVAKR